jgi:hypothetical protein
MEFDFTFVGDEPWMRWLFVGASAICYGFFGLLIQLAYRRRNWARITILALTLVGYGSMFYPWSDEADYWAGIDLASFAFMPLDALAMYWLFSGAGAAWFRKPWRATVRERIAANPEEFTLHRADGSRLIVPWSSVHLVRVFKVDLITTDDVLMRLEFDQPPCSLEISEEMDGFTEFAAVAGKRFDFPEGWRPEVTHPAFRTNDRVLYRRA